jgi:uncharacterized membrane protein YjfL (UPF0719 family)
MDWNLALHHLAQAILFGLVGIGMFLLALWLINRLSPFSAKKEIEQDQNVAFGIIVGSVLIGLALIVAAAIQG